MLAITYVRLTPPEDFKYERNKAGLTCPATLAEWRRCFRKANGL